MVVNADSSVDGQKVFKIAELEEGKYTVEVMMPGLLSFSSWRALLHQSSMSEGGPGQGAEKSILIGVCWKEEG